MGVLQHLLCPSSLTCGLVGALGSSGVDAVLRVCAACVQVIQVLQHLEHTLACNDRADMRYSNCVPPPTRYDVLLGSKAHAFTFTNSDEAVGKTCLVPASDDCDEPDEDAEEYGSAASHGACTAGAGLLSSRSGGRASSDDRRSHSSSCSSTAGESGGDGQPDGSSACACSKTPPHASILGSRTETWQSPREEVWVPITLMGRRGTQNGRC